MWQSIRVRLSVQYSALVFGIGGVILGAVYLALRSWLKSQTMMGIVIQHTWVQLSSGELVRMPLMNEVEMEAVQTVYASQVLNKAAQFTLVALLGLFLVSIVVGWVMSGRVLKPVGEITNVAREIQASDLSRRIALDGPDDELRRLANTFDDMLDRLDAAFTSQRQFLADTSHDLRTPLAVIQSNVELVSDDPSATIDDWRETGGIVRRNTDKMAAMIDGLLAAARLQTGKAQAVALDLSELIEAKAAEYGPIVAEKDVRIVTSGSTVTVQGVEVSLDRALANLVDNALNVAPVGSTVALSCGMTQGWGWMAVTDEGPGIPDEADQQIGLGLSIVRQIVQAHGGSLRPFSNDEGRGTTMVIWLPTPEADSQSPESRPEVTIGS